MGKFQLYFKEVREIAEAVGRENQKFAGKTILLTGGAGFLGSYFRAFFVHLNEEVLSRPCRVISMDNYITGKKREPREKTPLHFLNLRHNVIKPIRLKEPVDYIIHAAGIASPFYYWKYPLETLDAATTGTRNMLQLALKKRVKGFLFFSSSEIYGDPEPGHVPTPETYRGNVAWWGPRAPYDESKRLGETLCDIFHRQHHIPTKAARPFNVYGPGMREEDYRVLPNFASRLLNRKPLRLYGHGSQTRTFCYISDAIAGFIKVLLMGKPGEAYNIGNSTPEISMLGLAKLLEKVVGRKLSIELIERPAAYLANDPRRRCPDLTKAKTQIHYRPAIGLREGLSRFMSWAEETYHFKR